LYTRLLCHGDYFKRSDFVLRRSRLRRALSPTFPAGEMVFFIPWRVVAEESGAAPFGFGGALLLDLLGPMVRPPAAPIPF
jgi:hypothetical protein